MKNESEGIYRNTTYIKNLKHISVVAIEVCHLDLWSRKNHRSVARSAVSRHC